MSKNAKRKLRRYTPQESSSQGFTSYKWDESNMSNSTKDYCRMSLTKRVLHGISK